MRHDNTSAFNCRYVAGTSTWSQHAYGRAIDINPVENPYVDGGRVSPPRGRRYLDRSDVRRGMVVERDLVWRAFRRIGWEWGGTWTSAQDYQHFSATGR
jgi:poly-gamma-glutamate synthesis protein (capsule biosynthesis protein)